MRTDIPASDRLIVALDVNTKEQATKIVETLGESVRFYKVGWQLFMGSGMDVVTDLTRRGKKVFLDLKLHDTPRTVETAVKNTVTDGIEFYTLEGNGDTATAAKKGRGKRESPKFLQVTYLSSWDESDIREYFHLPDSEAVDLDGLIVKRARKILDSGCDGVIASGTSIARLRQTYPDLLIVSPGIRPEGATTDDHKRTLTPYEAIKAGANYLVVGRPVYNAADPIGTVRRIRDEIDRALKEITVKSASGEHYRIDLRHAIAH